MKEETPRANRFHIGLFGRRNSGKSSLVNMLTGQQVAVGYLVDERAVHYVEVYPVDIRRFAARELPGYIREVAGKQRS